MRIVLVGLISLAATTLSFGQGTVNLVNTTVTSDPLRLTTPPDRLVRYAPSAALLNPAFISGNGVFSNTVVGLRAQLYQGNSAAVEGTLTAVTTTPTTFRTSSSAAVGAWFNKTAVPLADIAPTNSGKLQVRVWDTAYAPTYEAAIALGAAYPGLLGKSAVFNYTPPDTNGTPAPADYNTTNLTTFTINVPSMEGPALVATNPTSVSKIVGETATFVGAGAGAPTLGYQWYKSPATPVGINSPTLTLPNVQLATAGGYYFVVSNGSGFATSTVATLTVTCPTITLNSSTLSNGTFGASYSATFTASGGVPTYSYAVTAGALPISLSLSSGGVLSGTVSAVPGVYNFTVTATDSGGSLCTGSSNYSITVNCPTVTINPSTLPNGGVGNAYTQTLAGVGGGAPYTFELNTNSPFGLLPTGLLLNTNTGVISGIPTANGTYIFQVVATDTNGCTGSQNYTNTIGVPDGSAIITLDTPKTKTDVATATAIVAGQLTADPSGFSAVEVNVNGTYISGATLHTNGSKITWTNSAVPLPVGTNTIFARLTDGSGQQGFSAKTNLVFRHFGSTLTLTFDAARGTVVGNALNVPATTASPQTPANAATLSVTRGYTLNVTPTAGTQLFSNVIEVVNGVSNIIYTADPAKAAQKGDKKVPFTMKTNLTLIVNFVTNDFQTLAGVYQGLFSEPAGASHQSAGWFTLKVKSNLKLSGKLHLRGETVPYSGSFNLGGAGVTKAGKIVSLKGKTNDPLTILLQLATGTVSGTISNGNWTQVADMDGNRVIDGLNLPIARPNYATSNFALVMVGSATPATKPGGDGYVLATFDPVKMVLKSKGYAGDGEKIKKTSITGLSTNGEWPFYSAIYSYYRTDAFPPHSSGSYKTYMGSIIGWLTVSNGNVTGDLVWNRAANSASTPAFTNVVYPNGFTNLHSDGDSTLLSSHRNLVLPLAPALPLSGTVTIQDGNLASPITDSFTYDPLNGKYTAAGVSTNGIKVKTKPTGDLSGTFDPVLKYKVFGAALPNAGTVRGVFTTGGNQSGSIRLTP